MIRWIKCTLAILVVVMWVLSIIILTLSTVIRDNLSHISLVTENTAIGEFYLGVFFPVIFPVLITVSCFVFVIGCLGCCGAFTESQILLGWFFFSILVTFCIELSAGIWRMVDYDLTYNTTDVLQLQLNIQQQYAKQQMSSAWFTSAWKEVHRQFHCCGVYSYNDWLKIDIRVLRTCCPRDVVREECAFMLTQMDGCGGKLLDYLSSSKHMYVIPYVTAIMGIVQVVAMILTLKLWLAFCFSAKQQLDEGEVPERTTAYIWDRNYNAFVRKTHDNTEGYHLSSLTSYKDSRYYGSAKPQPRKGRYAKYSYKSRPHCRSDLIARPAVGAHDACICEEMRHHTTSLSNCKGMEQRHVKNGQAGTTVSGNGSNRSIAFHETIGQHVRHSHSCSSLLFHGGWCEDPGVTQQNQALHCKSAVISTAAHASNALERTVGVGATSSDNASRSQRNSACAPHTGEPGGQTNSAEIDFSKNNGEEFSQGVIAPHRSPRNEPVWDEGGERSELGTEEHFENFNSVPDSATRYNSPRTSGAADESTVVN